MPLTEEEQARLTGMWVDGQMLLDHARKCLEVVMKDQKLLDELVTHFRDDLHWLRQIVERERNQDGNS